MSAASKRQPPDDYSDETEPEGQVEGVEGEPTQLLRKLREERRLSDAAFDTAKRTARDVALVARHAASSPRLLKV